MANDKGMKPGANMTGDTMQQSGNHATGNPGNDTPGVATPSNNRQQAGVPNDTNRALREGNAGRADLHNQQSASDAAKATTHRDRSAGARGDTGRS